MAGKQTVDPKLYAKIRRLRKQELSKKVIAERLSCSLYTVNVALDPDYRARGAARHRTNHPHRHAARLASRPDYAEYRTAYFAQDTYRDAVRDRMRVRRSKPTE